MENRTSEYSKIDNTRFYSPDHWKREFDVKSVHEILKTIPDSLRVSAQSQLVPHLAFRDYIYHYPYKGDANCIALLTANESKFPFNEVTYNEELKRLTNSDEWVEFAKNSAILVLIKKPK